jgi:two-component system, OmpR family, response regulator
MRICIVDDNAMVADALLLLLRDRGHEAFWAPDASAAEALIASERPDCTVLDLELPDMGGDVFAGRLRVRHPSMPVVLISGRAAPPHGAVGAAGADIYLPKPFTPGGLIEALQKAQVLRRAAA